MISGIPDSVQDSDLKLSLTSILLDIKLILDLGKWKTAKELVSLIMALKDFINRKLEKIYFGKHQFVSGTKIFISDNLTVKSEHLIFNCRY